jgi:hypothetical protein
MPRSEVPIFHMVSWGKFLVLYSGKYGILLFHTVYKILIFLENPVRKVTNFQGCVILLICNLPVDMT